MKIQHATKQKKQKLCQTLILLYVFPNLSVANSPKLPIERESIVLQWHSTAGWKTHTADVSVSLK